MVIFVVLCGLVIEAIDMNATDIIRNDFIEMYGTKRCDNADRVGMSATQMGRYLRKICGSIAVANYMAETHGGKYIELCLRAKQARTKAQLVGARKLTKAVRSVNASPETHHIIDGRKLPNSLQAMAGFIRRDKL